jgi:hypothetical protein
MQNEPSNAARHPVARPLAGRRDACRREATPEGPAVSIVLAMQGGAANGSEATFDGQPMQKGVHLRWTFLAALGFPPGGFWLCRRAAKPGEQRIPPPPSAAQAQAEAAGQAKLREQAQAAAEAARSMAASLTETQPLAEAAAAIAAARSAAASAGQPGYKTAGPARGPAQAAEGAICQVTMPRECRCVAIEGCALPGCGEVVVEVLTRAADGCLSKYGTIDAAVDKGVFRVCIQAPSISCIRVIGAGRIDNCCEVPESPPGWCCVPCIPCVPCGQGGSGQGGNGGWGGSGGGPPGCGNPGWGPPNDNGWQCWGVPFTLPVTVVGWPARYFGAPDPSSTADPVLAQADIAEARRRLGTLRLVAGQTAAEENAGLAQLRAELKRLVQGFLSGVLLADVGLQPASQSNAPDLGISLMQQLLLLALDPYFARVLGLYFVDEQAAAGEYDYVITGYWGGTPCASSVIYPGLAPAAPLARGSAVFDSLAIAATGGSTSLWRWIARDSSGTYVGRSDPSAPSTVQFAAEAAVSGIAQAQQPDALLLAYSPPSWFLPPAPRPQLSIGLSQPIEQADLQLAGIGTVQGLSGGTSIANVAFSSTQVATVMLTAPAGQVFDQLLIEGVSGISLLGHALALGALTLHPLSPDAIGTQYAIIPPPVAITKVAAPGQPYSFYRHRQADIDTQALKLVPHTLIDVEWPAPSVQAAQQTGNPTGDPEQLPPPTTPVGFIVQREDAGQANSVATLPGWIATRSAPKTKMSKVATDNLYRVTDSQLPDPVGGWSHRVAGFDLFGALGIWSNWSGPRGVEKIAAAPTAMRIVQFDNTPAGGGAASAGGGAWSSGTLKLLINWAGAAYMMYPDLRTARITVTPLAPDGTVGAELMHSDVVAPAPGITRRTIASITATPNADNVSTAIVIQTTPPLTALASTDPAQILMLVGADGSTDRYTVRPAVPASAGLNATSPVVATLTVGNAAQLATAATSYQGQDCYLVAGTSITPTLAVPLAIPVDQQTARAQVTVTGSTRNPFLANEQITDPNGVNPARPEPSAAISFSAPQRLTPPAPATPPPQAILVHQVNHLYYDPTDANGNASRGLPFTTPVTAGILGYVLQRCAMRSLAIADVKRRITSAGLTDNNPVVVDSGTPRADLASWIGSLTAWLAAYNAVASRTANPPGSFTPLTATNVLQDSGGQRAFIEHFYGGLLDDELRALADVAGNSAAYVRINPAPIQPGLAAPISDSVDGTGYGRTSYRLAAVNQAGSFSTTTGSIGPYYTQVRTPPRPPVLFKLQPTETGIVVVWALDANPDVAAYMVYRAAAVGDLADLRYFGADPTHPAAASALPAVKYNTQSYPPVTFVQGQSPNIDGRIIGFVPDPRLCARDYSGSDIAEVVLPPGPPPDRLIGVYRLTDYLPGLGPQEQVGFNYWTSPASGGIAQVVSSSPTQTRLTGLRIGLGRGVPVVVVAAWGAAVRVLGFVQNRRAGFIDAASASGQPVDPNTVPGSAAPNAAALNAYAIVAVDIFGNRSNPSSVFAAQMLQPPLAS